jgi:hypothetical protein
MESEPGDIFRDLPLSAEQNSEIRHYIHSRQRSGLPWDTPELHAMVADMLDPPEVVDEELQPWDASMAAECSTAEGEESVDADKLRSRHPG